MIFVFVKDMEKIDLKDRKILYELDLDARQSLTQIGKKVGLKKDMVSYRIKRMQAEGIIKNFVTVIDAYKLGYTPFRFYLTFQYVSSEKKNEIIQYFMNWENAWAVISLKTEIDLALIFFIKDLHDFYQFWNKTLDLYGDYFARKIFSAYIKGEAYISSYLLPGEHLPSERLHHKVSVLSGNEKPVEIDQIDYHLLNEIALNARIPLIELAEKLSCSSQTITYRINNLIKSGVIKGFRVNIDISKLGLEHFKADIYLKDHKQRQSIINYLKSNHYLTYMNMSLGYSDIEPEFFLENEDKFIRLIEDIEANFPNTIKNYTYFHSAKVHKLRFLPELNFSQ